MATLNCSGIDDLNAMLSKLGDIPEDVETEMLEAMAEVAMNCQKETGKSMNVYDPEWAGTHVLDSFKINKPKKNKSGVLGITITFKGTRTRGNTKTRNAEIAFINEFGADDRGIAAKPFIQNANTKNIEKIYVSGEKVWNRWIDSLENNK